MRASWRTWALLTMLAAACDSNATLGGPDGGVAGDAGPDGDLDGDGLPNASDPDDDGDGIPDAQDVDDDNDGILDVDDPDDDNDGIPDPQDGCVSGGTECTDCIDNDGDGQTDGFDIECISADDDREDSFATGIPGDNIDPKIQDCFFDGDSGAGNDGCRYHTCCLLQGDCPADLEPFDPATDCVVAAKCQDVCEGATVPGCDCFGCCTLCDDAGCETVLVNPAVAPECDGSTIHDAAKCPACTPSTDCGNPCIVQDPASCVLCPGQDPGDLPASCTPPPPEGDDDFDDDQTPNPVDPDDDNDGVPDDVDPDDDNDGVPDDVDPDDDNDGIPDDQDTDACTNPDGCTGGGGGTGQLCPGGNATCGTSSDCPSTQFCSQGCCINKIG